MSNNNNRALPSFRTELNIKMMLLVLIPVLLSAIYLSYNAYKQAIELAQDDIQRHASSLALDIKTEITAQKYNFSSLSNNKVLGEIAVNILYSQYAFNQLKDIVLSSPAIDAAFISDGSEFIIEGFPLKTLTISDQTLTEFAHRIIERTTTKTVPQLFYLSSDKADLASDGSGYFFIVLPLRRQLSSLVQPFENTAALFLLLNPKKLFAADRQGELSSLKLMVNGHDYYDHLWVENHLLSVQESIFYAEDDGLEVSVVVGQASSKYTEKVWSSIGVTIAFIAVMLILVLAFMKNFTTRLNRPIKILESQSKHFIDGDYYISTENVEFLELENLKQTLNTMAQTITKQLQSLKQERNNAEASERMKARFLANMSHEIRTPLNGVHGLLKMIASEPLSANQKAWLANANKSANLLLSVVNDILDFSKVEEGKVAIENIAHDLTETIAAIESTGNTLIKEKSLQFEVKNQLSHSYWLCDPARLSQILINLVSNAIKFTSAGKVTFVVTEKNTDQGDFLLFSINDTGIGIAPEKMDKLFNSFEQADVSTTRKFGGTGLGLAISKRLANLMDGDITVNSELNKGSTFILTLPMKRAIKPVENSDSELFTPDLSQYHILVAEDNKINRMILAHALEQTHASVTFVENGQLALDKTAEISPDLILMDVQMPVMDGVEATEKIRAAGYQGPIIMQTANVLDEEIASYLKIGANAHISKPIDADKMFQVMVELLS
ncbi:ATP-binding protein [Colwelliaceae bacterium 6471]